ncbi:MAG: hypothetical protein GTO40_13965 [Deltaproteobacteria bacterium]|nr:hypothetical protein [Deltaproteobacteria bacterium]
MDRRSRLLFLSAVFLPLASAVGAIFLLIWILKRVSPEVFAARYSSGLELLIGMAILLIALMAGFFVGTLMLVIIWRPYVSRSALEGIVTKPDVPIISQVLAWVFNQIYPIDE